MNRFILFTALILTTFVFTPVLGQINIDSCKVIITEEKNGVSDVFPMNNKEFGVITKLLNPENPEEYILTFKHYNNSYELIDSSNETIKKSNIIMKRTVNNEEVYCSFTKDNKGFAFLQFVNKQSGDYKVIKFKIGGIIPQKMFSNENYTYLTFTKKNKQHILSINNENEKQKIELIELDKNNHKMGTESIQCANNNDICFFLGTFKRKEYYAMHIDNKNQQTITPLHEFTEHQIDDAIYTQIGEKEYVYIGFYGKDYTDYGLFFMHVKDGALLASTFTPFYELKEITEYMTYNPEKTKKLLQEYNSKEASDLINYSLALSQIAPTKQGYFLSADLIIQDPYPYTGVKNIYTFSIFKFDHEGKVIWANHLPTNNKYFINQMTFPNTITTNKEDYIEVAFIKDTTLERGKVYTDGRYENYNLSSILSTPFKDTDNDPIIVYDITPWYDDTFLGQRSLKTPKQGERGYIYLDIIVKLSP